MDFKAWNKSKYKKYLVKTFNILFVAYSVKQKHIHKNPKAFKCRSFCFGLLYLSKSIWPVIYGYWYSELPVASF